MRVLGQIGNFALGIGGKGMQWLLCRGRWILDRRAVVIIFSAASSIPYTPEHAH